MSYFLLTIQDHGLIMTFVLTCNLADKIFHLNQLVSVDLVSLHRSHLVPAPFPIFLFLCWSPAPFSLCIASFPAAPSAPAYRGRAMLAPSRETEATLTSGG